LKRKRKFAELQSTILGGIVLSKKMWSVLLVVVMILSLGLTACAPKAEEPAAGGETPAAETPAEKVYISIATGGTAGTYYPLGGAIAKIFNENVPGVTANAQATGASVENVGLVSKGEAEIAFVQNDVTFYAYNGTEIFADKEKITNIRGMAMLYPEVVQIIATKDSGIASVDDLKGKKVAVGAPGSGAEANARQILEAHGIKYEDLAKADFLSFNEAADQIKNKQIDAAFITAGLPTSAISEVAQTADIVIVPIDSAKITEMIAAYPFYTEVVVPGGTYKGNDTDVTTAAVMAMLIVGEDMDETLAYNLTKSMFEQRQVIIDTHQRGNDIKLETALVGMPIDLHPGAQKYYDEMGIK
jgi:uncharacterized protein